MFSTTWLHNQELKFRRGRWRIIRCCMVDRRVLLEFGILSMTRVDSSSRFRDIIQKYKSYKTWLSSPYVLNLVFCSLCRACTVPHHSIFPNPGFFSAIRFKSQTVSRRVAILQAWVGHESAQLSPSLLVSSGNPAKLDTLVSSICFLCWRSIRCT